ncbi:MAG: AraC family transcriptional regulator [bacterium]
MPLRSRQQDAGARWQEFERNELISLIRVHVYCTYRSVLGPAWRTVQSHDAKDRVYYVNSGSGEVTHHGQVYPLRPGGLYLIPAHTPHSHACDERLDLYWCHFAAETCYGTPLFAHLTLPYACHVQENDAMPALFEAMVRLYKDDSPGAVFRRSGLLMQVLAPFIEQADMGRWRLLHLRADQFTPVLDLIDRRLTDSLSIDELARAAHLSRGYFMSRFKATFGLSPHQYQLLKRIEKARQRLVNTSDTISQISSDLGFSDAFHFSRLFKKMTGRSPRDYRKSHRPDEIR